MHIHLFKGAKVKIYYFYVDEQLIDVEASSRRKAKKLVLEAFPHKPIIYIAKQKKRV